MEYVQERITTLHDFGDVSPSAPLERTTIVVPLAQRDHSTLSADRVLSTLERIQPDRVIVPVRATEDEIGTVVEWIDGFDLNTETLWCTAPAVESRLRADGLDGTAGKGRDVWLGLGLASDSEYVVVHDADTISYDETHVPRLLFALSHGFEFVKGYYARVENDRLYGRLVRLFWAPLVRALRDTSDAPYLTYLDSFRYSLAGEFAMTGNLARSIRIPRGWGLEVGVLGDAFEHAGFSGTAQADLGVHEHDHRSVEGPSGLGEMCTEVGRTLFNTLADHDVRPDFKTLPGQYRDHAHHLIDQYEVDAAFNDLTYNRDKEREQVDRYVQCLSEPTEDTRLPPWEQVDLDPETVQALSADAIAKQL
jgi:glucosyl-3-phosphoglycerate synthase